MSRMTPALSIAESVPGDSDVQGNGWCVIYAVARHGNDPALRLQFCYETGLLIRGCRRIDFTGDWYPPQNPKSLMLYIPLESAIHTSIVSLAGSVRPFLDDPNCSRFVRRGLSLALGAIAIWFAFSAA